MVFKNKKAEAFLGNIKINDAKKSRKEIASLKNLFLNKTLKKGKKLKIDDITTKRIGKNSYSKKLKLIGKKQQKN